MNWSPFERDWDHCKADFQRHWPMLTDARLDTVAGNRDRLVGALSAAYGMNAAQAEAQLANWQDSRQRESESPEWRAGSP